jgi:hypothetical protein
LPSRLFPLIKDLPLGRIIGRPAVSIVNAADTRGLHPGVEADADFPVRVSPEGESGLPLTGTVRPRTPHSRDRSSTPVPQAGQTDGYCPVDRMSPPDYLFRREYPWRFDCLTPRCPGGFRLIAAA